MYTKVIKFSKKCGPAVIGASILGGASLIGTGASIATNASNQSYGSAQSDAARKWSTNERLAAQAYNTSERLATQEYNSPTHMAQMFRAAGLNPTINASTMASAASSPMSSSPASSGIASPGNAVVPNIPQLISSGADLVNAMSKSKETEASLPLINQQVQYMLQQTFGQQITNDLLDLEKKLKGSTLPADIKRAFEEVSKLGVEKAMMQQLGKKYEKDTELLEAQKNLAKATEKLTGEQAIQAQYLTQNWHRSFESMLNLQRAQANASNASATESLASARDLSATAEGKELQNNIARATNLVDIDNALFNADTLVLLQQSSDKESLWQQLQRDVKKSSAYKNSENQKRIDASLEKLRQILGINVSVGVSNK